LCRTQFPVERNWPLRITCMVSMPATVIAAVRKLLKRSTSLVIRVTARWSCSTMLLQQRHLLEMQRRVVDLENSLLHHSLDLAVAMRTTTYQRTPTGSLYPQGGFS